MNCPQCGKPLKPGARFCTGCGTQPAAATPGSSGAGNRHQTEQARRTAAPMVSARTRTAAPPSGSVIDRVIPQKTQEQRRQEQERESALYAAAIRNARIAGLASSILSGLLWGWLVKTTEYEFGYFASFIGGICGFSVLVMSKERTDSSFQFIAAWCGALGILIGKLVTYLYFHEQIAQGEFTLFSLYDILWLGLAGLAAWELPVRGSFFFNKDADMRVQNINKIDVPDAVIKDEEEDPGAMKSRAIIIAASVVGVCCVLFLLYKLIFGVAMFGKDNVVSEPFSGESHFHAHAFLTIPAENWYMAEYGYFNNRAQVVAVYHRGPKKHMDARLKIFKVDYYDMDNFDIKYNIPNGAPDLSDPEAWSEFYTGFIMKSEGLEYVPDSIEYQGFENIFYTLYGHTGEGKKELQHQIYVTRGSEDRIYYLWFTVFNTEDPDVINDINSIAGSVQFDDAGQPY